MIFGRGAPVCQNGSHEAWPYMFPNGHSVTGEWNYLSPMSAVWQAWKLRSELVLQVSGQPCASPILSSRANDSCFLSHQVACSSQDSHRVRRKSMRVHFDDCIELQIGVEDSWQMYSTFVRHDVLQFWNEKPWSYTPKPKSLIYSWRKLTNLFFPFADFSQNHRIKCELFDECDESMQSLPTALVHPSAMRCPAETVSSKSDWILQLQRLASISSDVCDSDESDRTFLVRVWILAKGRHIHHSVPDTLMLTLDCSSWKRQILSHVVKRIKCSDGFDFRVVHHKSDEVRQDGIAADLIVTMQPHLCSVFVVARTVHSVQGVFQLTSSKVATGICCEASLNDMLSHALSIVHDFGLHDIVSVCFFSGDKNQTKPCDGMCIEVIAFQKNCTHSQRRQEENFLSDITHVSGSLNGAPQSSVAVLSSSRFPISTEKDKENIYPQPSSDKKAEVDQVHEGDQVSVMQRHVPGSIGFKTSPLDDHQENMVSAFQQDRTGTGELGQEAAMSESSGTEDHPSSSNAGSSGIQPPSSPADRQEVVLFHMDDHPIRAFINWNSYEEMMHDIAYTYAIEREALVDAYEIAVPVSDVGENAVPTIAHIVDDVPFGRADKLALFDVQYHAHKIELNFRLGPVVVRSVLSVPPISVRDDMLQAANVDRFCRFEDNRCLVFINERRWPDYDEAPRVISHGDYVRIGVPPSERFACSTMTLAEMVQQGRSDQQILDAIYEDEIVSNVSPSMLNDTEVRDLAPNVSHQADDLQNFFLLYPNEQPPSDIADHETEESSDAFQAMQTDISSLIRSPSSPHDNAEDSLSPIPDDWILDLTRVVRDKSEQCQPTEDHEFLFSVYTWMVDHEGMRLCREPKIVVLGPDRSEWAEDIREPWRFHISLEEHVFYDLVTPFSQRSGIEEHIAHIILSKKVSHQSSVLVSLNFCQEEGPSVIVRFATALPRECSFADVAAAVPLLDSFLLNQIEWEFPLLSHFDQLFETRHGLGIQIKIYPEPIEASSTQSEVISFLQHGAKTSASGDHEIGPKQEISSWNQLHGSADVVCSLTDEFLAFVQAASTANEGDPAPVDDAPTGLRSQPIWVQDVWEKWVETLHESAIDPQRGPRLETWFTRPNKWSRCSVTRIVELSTNFHQWQQELLAAWHDKADASLPTEFAVVFPTPDDADRSAQEQIIIEQQPESFSKSVIVSVYDTSIDKGSPHSIAIVLSDRIDLKNVVTMMGYSELCPPERMQNECSLWLGHTAIRSDQVVHTRTGNAFKLLVKFGIEIGIAELLSMSDSRLRVELQSAISGSVFRRPNIQGFPADAFSTGNPISPVGAGTGPPNEYPPDWLNSLQEAFDRKAFVENADEGEVMYVHVWFVHGTQSRRNDRPAVVRLDKDSAWWSSEIRFPWRDELERGVSVSIHFIDPIPPKEPWQSQEAHIVISQRVADGQVPVVVSTRTAGRDGVRLAHEARIVNKYSSAIDFTCQVTSSSSSPPCLVSRGRQVFPSDHTVHIGPGDGIMIQSFDDAVSADPCFGPEDVSASSVVGQDASMHGLELSQVNARCGDENTLEEDDDESLMQRLHNFQDAGRSEESQQQDPNDQQQPSCAVGIDVPVENEHDGFQFNANAAAFQPGQPLPEWVQTIDEMYQLWEVSTFAWQYEERAAQFMTWFVAPAINRRLCRLGREVTLFADFWNWKDRLKQVWRNEIDHGIDFEIVLVQPPPTFLGERIVGHVILIQHNAPEWSTVLLTVFDRSVSPEGPFQLVASVRENLVLNQLLPPAGYPDDVLLNAICTFRLRNHLFSAHERCRPSDGDSFDIVFQGYGSMPPVRPDNGNDGLNLLQVRSRVTNQKLHGNERAHQTADERRCRVHVLALAQHIVDDRQDIRDVPVTIALANKEAIDHGMLLVFCVWELHGGQNDIETFPTHLFAASEARSKFATRFDLVVECSPLFPVNYIRDEWGISKGNWHVGSFVQPSPGFSVVACITYGKQGAHVSAKTLPEQCQLCTLRTVLGTKFGTFVRINGNIVNCSVTLKHGDVVEFHAAEPVKDLLLQKAHKKVQVCLDASISFGCPSFVEDADATEVLPMMQIRELLQAQEDWIFQLIPEGLNLHKMTLEALHIQQDVVPTKEDILELYVDGATHGDLSAWAVVAVLKSDNGRSFHGCIGGLTEIDSGSGRWVGAVRHTNIEAELTAMVVATAFAYFGSAYRHVVIRPDLALSNKFLKSECITQQSSGVAQVLHVIGQCRPSNIDVSEIRAHCGDPWNELADSVAKWVARTRQSIGKVPWSTLNDLAKSPSMLRWEWLRNENPAYAHAMPELHGGAVWQPGHSIKHVGVHVDTKTEHHEVMQINLKVATFNGLALSDDNQSGPLGGLRSARLDHQFHVNHLAIIGVQEARTAQGSRVSENYKIISSGFQQCGRTKHYGCELWVHKKIPFCSLPNGKGVCLSECKLTVRVAEARLLIVRFEGPIDFHVIVAHAPCVSQDRPLDLVRRWWTELSEKLSSVACQRIIALVDANAPLANSDTKFVGPVGAEEMNPQGEAFQDFICAHGLFVPSTLTMHRGGSATWSHPRGIQLRRDYVLLSESFYATCIESKVLSDFDGGFGHVDHCPAVCCMKGLWNVTRPGAKLKWDLDKVKDPDAQKAFQEALQSLPLPAWTVDVDDHSAIVETNIVQIAQQHFGTIQKVKNRPLLQEATLNAIQLKRQALDLARSQDFSDPLLVSELKQLEKIVRPMVLQDQQSWYDSWLHDIDDAGARHDTAQVYKKLQRLGRRKKDLSRGPRPLPCLKTKDGSNAGSFQECQSIWRDQFSRIEAGVVVSETQLAQLHESSISTGTSELANVPGPWEILAIIRRFKNGKVPGPGQLPVDILKGGGLAIAKILTPLITKAIWHQHEPLTWKGGILVPLFKGKGAPSDAEAYRSIFISDICAKVHHAHVRQRLADVWQKDDVLIQLGGKKKCSTDIAHHLLHAHLSWARHSVKSCAVLFVDLRSAFYSILRSSLFDGEFGDVEICYAMKLLGIKPHEWQEIRSAVCKGYAVSGIDAHHEGILKDMFSGTHFTMQGLTGQTATMRGTRPGDPVADILFNMAFKLVVTDARQRILLSSDLQWFGTPHPSIDVTSGEAIPAKGFAEVTFVDDIAYALHSTSADSIISSLQVVASCLHDAAAVRGLSINYQAGKTEAIVRLAGQGSKKAKHQIWHENSGKLPILTEHGCQFLRLVHSYKHLGTFVQDHAVIQMDLRYRNTQARKAYGQLSRQFYCKRNVNDATKIPVFSALVMSRHAYNVHTWAWMTQKDVDHWQNGIRNQVAALAKNKVRPISPLLFTTAELCALIGLHSPEDLLHANRLRYVKRAILVAPGCLWSLLYQNTNCNSWMPHFLESCAWLWSFVSGQRPQCFEVAAEAVSFIAMDEKWNGRVRSALKSCLQFRKAGAEGKLWTMRLQHQLSKFGVFPSLQSAQKTQVWTCTLCCESFGTRRALAVHARHKHQYKTMLKYYVLGDHCLACGRMFFCRTRLLAHVGQSQDCKDTYLACLVPAPEDVVEQIENEERESNQKLKSQGWLPSKAFLPVTIVHGPLLPKHGTSGASAMQAKWRARTQSPGTAFEGLDGYCEHSEVPRTEATEILPFLMQTNGGSCAGHAGAFQHFGLAAEAAKLHIKCLLFVHFFSGYRREGDLQHCIEHHAVEEGCNIFCISVDICLAKQHSDFTDSRTKQFWISKIQSGQILGIGGGPSCETWSAARYGPGGPPPVRSYDHPWGLRKLTKRQWQQVQTGTKLVQFLVELLCYAAQAGLCGFLEHPQFAVWMMQHRPASIWTLDVMRWLARLECVQICSFDQCVYGLDAKKPTTLLLLRLETFKDTTVTRGLRGRCSHRGGHRPLQGIEVEGDFATARAKVYPKAMNSALALAVSRFLATRQVEGTWQRLPDDLQELMSNEFVDLSTVQPDFYR